MKRIIEWVRKRFKKNKKDVPKYTGRHVLKSMPSDFDGDILYINNKTETSTSALFVIYVKSDNVYLSKNSFIEDDVLYSAFWTSNINEALQFNETAIKYIIDSNAVSKDNVYEIEILLIQNN